MGTSSHSGGGAITPSGAHEEQRRAIERVHRQHVEIGDFIHDLSTRLGEAEGRTHEGDARHEIGSRLARLQSTLAEHFADEERIGFVPKALETAPRLTKRARRIVSQHDLLRIELAEVAGVLDRETSGWQQVRERFQSFTEALQEHERRENELINEALMDDLGGGG